MVDPACICGSHSGTQDTCGVTSPRVHPGHVWHISPRVHPGHAWHISPRVHLGHAWQCTAPHCSNVPELGLTSGYFHLKDSRRQPWRDGTAAGVVTLEWHPEVSKVGRAVPEEVGPRLLRRASSPPPPIVDEPRLRSLGNGFQDRAHEYAKWLLCASLWGIQPCTSNP